MALRVDYEQRGRTYARFRRPDPRIAQRIVDRLRKDLASGAWDAHHGHLRDLTSYDGALRLVIAESA
jgi:hypothetical protein